MMEDDFNVTKSLQDTARHCQSVAKWPLLRCLITHIKPHKNLRAEKISEDKLTDSVTLYLLLWNKHDNDIRGNWKSLFLTMIR